MPQYVVRLVHTSDQCPTSNSKIRERIVKGAPEIPKLAQRLGVKFLAGPLALPTEHVAIAVVQADSVETVEEFIWESGLMQWNTVRVSTAKPLEQVLNDLEKSPPPLY